MMYYRYAETVYWVHMRYDERASFGLSEFAGSGAAAETVVPESDATTSATADTLIRQSTRAASTDTNFFMIFSS